MADWTELLPQEMETPIVIEIRFPDGWIQHKPEAVKKFHADIESLVDDPEWLNSKSEILRQLGADHIVILTNSIDEHWVAMEGEPGRADRRPGPPGGDVYFNVYLPPTVAATAADEERATRTVMDWFEASKVGQTMLRTARGLGMRHASAGGVRYVKKADLGHIRQREEINEVIHSGRSRSH